MILVSICLFLSITTIVTLFGWARFVKPGKYYANLKDAPGDGSNAGGRPQTSAASTIASFARKVGERVRLSAKNSGLYGRLLLQAGYRDARALPVFVGLKLCSAVLFGFGAAGLLAALRFDAGPSLLVTLTGAFLGYTVPGMVLRRRATARQERLRLALPDALDLMVVSVESGIGIDQAIRHVGRELRLSHPELSQELSVVCLEMLAGQSRAEALTNLAHRNNEDGLRKLVAVLVQTDRFGTSVVDALRTHADSMRTRRRQAAEERAGKISVKLVFPIFFFLLPAILVVCAGPGALAIYRQLIPALKGLH